MNSGLFFAPFHHPKPMLWYIRQKANTQWFYLISCCLQQADPGLFSNNSCSSLNETELAGFDEQPLSAQNLSLFRCYMMNVSLVTIEVTPLVQEISQYCEAAAAQMPGYVGPVSCSPPPFEEVEDAFTFVRCLLMLLNQLLSKHKL